MEGKNGKACRNKGEEEGKVAGGKLGGREREG